MGSASIILQVIETMLKTPILINNTRASFHDHLAVPKWHSNAGLQTFHASATYLWNCLDNKFKTITMKETLRNF